MSAVSDIWCMFDLHSARFAFSLESARTGKSKLARMAIIVMTTSNSINVNPPLDARVWLN
jgi:hypothetical protein